MIVGQIKRDHRHGARPVTVPDSYGFCPGDAEDGQFGQIDDRGEAQPADAALRLKGIVKTFPGVRALDGVDFEVMPGEVHTLLGENGAGKSTLMKVLAGMYQPDERQIIIAGQPVRMSTTIEARAQGVVLIHQELSLVPEMSAAENTYLGELPQKSFGRVDWKTLE